MDCFVHKYILIWTEKRIKPQTMQGQKVVWIGLISKGKWKLLISDLSIKNKD